MVYSMYNIFFSVVKWCSLHIVKAFIRTDNKHNINNIGNVLLFVGYALLELHVNVNEQFVINYNDSCQSLRLFYDFNILTLISFLAKNVEIILNLFKYMHMETPPFMSTSYRFEMKSIYSVSRKSMSIVIE